MKEYDVLAKVEMSAAVVIHVDRSLSWMAALTPA